MVSAIIGLFLITQYLSSTLFPLPGPLFIFLISPINLTLLVSTVPLVCSSTTKVTVTVVMSSGGTIIFSIVNLPPVLELGVDVIAPVPLLTVILKSLYFWGKVSSIFTYTLSGSQYGAAFLFILLLYLFVVL